MAELASERWNAETSALDPLVFGQRLRHLRRTRGLTLDSLGERVGRKAPYLSMVENGKREPGLSLIDRLAAALDVSVSELLAAAPPTRRSELEIAFERAQSDPMYQRLDLPPLKPSARLPDEALEHLVALFGEAKRRTQIRAATPEEARVGNAALRHQMRDRGNYFAEIEQAARKALDAAGYDGAGPVPQRMVVDLAAHLGFALRQTHDLPSGVRSVTDLRHRRIYIPQRDALEPQAARSVVLQTLGHFVLAHEDPRDFAEFLRQRVEANYFAGAVLMPEQAAVPMLQRAKAAKDLAIEELEDYFSVSYEMAAHRFTNLATKRLDIPVHFVRSDAEGIIWKAYENDDVPFPADPDGAIEGQRLCRRWGTRQVFSAADRFSMHYQYTDTPRGTYWCVTYLESDRQPPGAVTVGARFADARSFRGWNTRVRAESACPDGPCCRSAAGELDA
ncbi:MAG TPA: helix-turn-helix domain-containing protein, partial [Egibacteraceae bacterium]|nr:helix-turn-helix domain-containing protein [Egibacteraceae bacterium]